MRQKTKLLLAVFVLLVSSFTLFAQEKNTITGTVKDGAGLVLTGATVKEKGTNNSVLTKTNGGFSIKVSPDATLLISFVGFKTAEVSTSGQSVIEVSLEQGEQQLNEVVVTALGIKREQRKIGYATTQVSGKDIVKSSPTNFASALYGKAPGVQINTQPGGATSAVSIQIRGLSSLSGQGQPLLVVDGVIVRNGDANNEGYWGGNQKLNGNGLLDINPENVENISILKGAAASALYGSDAMFGVILVTTKSGKGYNKGIGVDVNFSANTESVAVVPDLQTKYGPGYDRGTNLSAGADEDGWFHLTVNGNNVVRPYSRAYGQFGPKMDGRDVYWWDGSTQKFTAQKNNWKAFYRNGYSTIANVAINNATDKMNYRFSYTRNDYKGIQVGGMQGKNTFNLNSSYKITPKITLDLVASYINEKVENRPRQIYYLTNNFGGFFSPADRMDVYLNKYQTSKGYKWVDYNSTLDLDERLKYNIRAKDFLDFLWNQLANKYSESSNRLMNSLTLNYNIIKGLNFRGRFGSDYTGIYVETKERSTQPLSAGASGRYATNNDRYINTYGDVLLSYQKQIIPKLSVTASAGYQARKSEARYNYASTRDGLTTENWFSLSASKTTPTEGSTSRAYELKDGLFGILSFDYNNYLFVEGTLRRERTSTLHPDNNTFYYPGISGAFELSNAFQLPASISYSKIRASWGVVGNPPSAYYSNVIYNAGNIQGVPILTPPSSNYGNDELKNERKSSIEFGLETRMFANRFGFDLTYYNDKLSNQILTLTIPATSGSTSVASNVGNMRNYGIELSVYGTPVKSHAFAWDARLNLAFNRNKVVSLMEGLDYLTHSNIDNGSLLVKTNPGEKAGNIYVYKRKTDANGNYIINSDGLYVINPLAELNFEIKR